MAGLLVFILFFARQNSDIKPSYRGMSMFLVEAEQKGGSFNGCWR